MGKIPAHAKDYAMKDFGKHIKYCRELRDIKQSELADMVGVTQQTISTMERKAGKIRVELMYAINKAVQLDMIQILKACGFTLPQIRDYFREYFKDKN